MAAKPVAPSKNASSTTPAPALLSERLNAWLAAFQSGTRPTSFHDRKRTNGKVEPQRIRQVLHGNLAKEVAAAGYVAGGAERSPGGACTEGPAVRGRAHFMLACT